MEKTQTRALVEEASVEVTSESANTREISGGVVPGTGCLLTVPALGKRRGGARGSLRSSLVT